MRSIKLILFLMFPLAVFSQKHCKCNADKIAGWDTRDKGLNHEILNGQPDFQHPVTTFYRNQGSWYNPDKYQNVKLKSIEFYKFGAIAKNEPFTSIKS